MAKNYTIKEACEIIANGTDLEAITDIGRRYPVLAHKLAVVTAKASEEVVDLMSYMPEYLTANKVNSAIKKSIGGGSDDEAEDDAAEAETAEDDGDETATAKWDENMSAKQLWDILGKAGKRKLAKSTKKADLVAACKEAFGDAADADADTEDEAAEETGAYDGKSAMELFKECKKRGIKAAAKKPAKFYADLLTKDDAKADDSEETDADAEDDWDEPEEKEESKAKKPTKAAPTKKAPAAKKAKADEDDGDDWDI